MVWTSIRMSVETLLRAVRCWGRSQVSWFSHAFGERSQDFRELRAFQRISALSFHPASLYSNMQQAVDELSQITGCPTVMMVVVDGDRPTAITSQNSPHDPDTLFQHIYSTVQTVAQHNHPLIESYGDVRRDSPFQTAVYIPLAIRHQGLGALCLMDPPWPTVGDRDLQWLRRIAQILALKIDHCQMVRRLEDSEERFHLVSRAIKGSIYDWDIPSGRVLRTSGMTSLLGFLPEEVEPTRDWWLDHVHPDDHIKLADLDLLDRDEFELEYRFRNRDGEYVTVLDRGVVLWDSQGAPARMLGYMIDITQRKQILEERDRFFMLSADMLCIIGLDGTFKRVNPACERILGYRPSEMVGRNYMNFIHPGDQATTRSALDAMLQNSAKTGSETKHRCENRYRCKDGRYKWIQWSAFVAVEQTTIYSVGRDVTEQKLAQAQLRERDARLRSIFEQSSLGMAYCRMDGSYLEANQQFCDFFGYTVDELHTLTFRDLTHPNHLEISDTNVRQLQSGEVSSFAKEKRYIRKDGAIVWGKVTVSAIRDEAGTLQSMGIILEDINERKLADVALAESQQRYKSLINAIDGIVWEFDLSTLLFSFVSKKAEDVLGYPLERWTTEPQFWENHIHPEDRDWVVSYCWESTQAGEDHYFEYRMIAADGRIVWFENVVSVIVEQGKPIRLQGILIDIGDRKRMEAERQTAEQALAEQLQREQLFVEVTQHMRQSLDLNTVLSTAVEDVRCTLQADRALIYYLNEDRIGRVIQESVREGYASVLNTAWADECFPEDCSAFYLQGQPRIVADVDTDAWSECLTDYAHEMGIQSKIVAPILQPVDGDSIRIWGLLCIHACAEKRVWQMAEAELLQHIADQLAIAIQQSELYHRLQQANQDLEYLATHDKLTKIANRRSFEDISQQEWHRLAREQQPISLIMADIDFFKQYNDTYDFRLLRLFRQRLNVLETWSPAMEAKNL
ncbi:MAG: PAS domain-containing protein [Synechococcales cyanobacterium T60_A2020_003]|nr:PAS domain-containing protein [Synechococcales cyanobacterium T60_A2020_003]